VWLGGFQRAFLDSEKQYIFSFQAESTPSVYVNRDLVPESELNSVKALLDPRWKGKIAIHDRRIDGAGNGRIAVWIGLLGEDFARSILSQEVAVTQDGRQLAEWLVRGRHPIAIGLAPTQLLEFTRQGVGLSVRPITEKSPEAWQLNSGFGVVRLISNPPHPSAAKVFLNWLLSRDGQEAWVTKAQRASRRTDVPRIEGLSPAADIDYFATDLEEHLPLREQGQQLAKEILG
jgi:iron(III) transport system substrate-binding protein